MSLTSPRRALRRPVGTHRGALPRSAPALPLHTTACRHSRLPAPELSVRRRGRCHPGAAGGSRPPAALSRRSPAHGAAGQAGPPPCRRRGSAAAMRVTSLRAALRASPRAGAAPQPNSLRAPAPGPAPRRAAGQAGGIPCAPADRRGPFQHSACAARAGLRVGSRSRCLAAQTAQVARSSAGVARCVSPLVPARVSEDTGMNDWPARALGTTPQTYQIQEKVCPQDRPHRGAFHWFSSLGNTTRSILLLPDNCCCRCGECLDLCRQHNSLSLLPPSLPSPPHHGTRGAGPCRELTARSGRRSGSRSPEELPGRTVPNVTSPGRANPSWAPCPTPATSLPVALDRTAGTSPPPVRVPSRPGTVPGQLSLIPRLRRVGEQRPPPPP
ncbi:uncharacterized protein [Heliangelus exortis]|uniref:uncharacterized protein n=1 Tax=Heliangelus exortis TaxID=472823 RepID=UPI003A948267